MSFVDSPALISTRTGDLARVEDHAQDKESNAKSTKKKSNSEAKGVDGIVYRVRYRDAFVAILLTDDRSPTLGSSCPLIQQMNLTCRRDADCTFTPQHVYDHAKILGGSSWLIQSLMTGQFQYNLRLRVL